MGSTEWAPTHQDCSSYCCYQIPNLPGNRDQLYVSNMAPSLGGDQPEIKWQVDFIELLPP